MGGRPWEGPLRMLHERGTIHSFHHSNPNKPGIPNHQGTLVVTLGLHHRSNAFEDAKEGVVTSTKYVGFSPQNFPHHHPPSPKNAPKRWGKKQQQHWSAFFFKTRTELAGAQPPTNCSFARHLVGKWPSFAHLLITKHQPGKDPLRSPETKNCFNNKSWWPLTVGATRILPKFFLGKTSSGWSWFSRLGFATVGCGWKKVTQTYFPTNGGAKWWWIQWYKKTQPNRWCRP